MNWEHRVSQEWLVARRDVLTASEIKSLIPEWKRLAKKPLKPGEISPGFAGLWCQKNTDSIPDPVSWGAAARGHYMEPYAVETYNRFLGGEVFHHWDDCVIKSNGLGFSPDAMDVKQENPGVECRLAKGKLRYASGAEIPAPKRILEIKSYEPLHHMKSILKDKMDHEELIQVAVAFAVLPKLEEATLLFYCPDAPYPAVFFEYGRDELKDEIERIEQISSFYATQSKLLESLPIPRVEPVCSEAEVWRLEMTDVRVVRG
ncbi:MAG: hypothetical protein II488_07455 [Firmicutes bacterium]|nr:hypothetical protein [Bacillota bacterium]